MTRTGLAISVVERLADGLVVLRYEDRLYGVSDEAVWSRVKLRKKAKCRLTDRFLLPGEQAYRPVGNQSYRMERIAADAIEKGVQHDDRDD